MNRTLLVLLALILIASVPSVAADAPDEIVMHYFWGEGCPFCEMQKPYNQRLLDDHPYLTIESYEVYRSAENQRIFQEMAAEHGVQARGVPMTFIEGYHWSGFTERHYREMNDTITRLAQNLTVERPDTDSIITLPFIGDVDLADSSLFVTTIAIAFIDGFNPCSLWLLTFLLGILLLTKSRRKMIIIGGTFLLVTATAYGAFIAGLFSVFQYTAMIAPIRYIVGTIALIFAAVNIKDFFWYKKGISFTISDEHKPGLFKKMRGIMRPGQSTGSMIAATAFLALGVTLIELPCTAGFPVLWSSLVALQDPGFVGFLSLLAVYILIYLGIEIVILVSAIVTLNKLVFTEHHGRVLKLFGGMIMLFLAIGFVFAYEFMNTINGMLTLMGGAILASLLVYIAHRSLAKPALAHEERKASEPQTKDDATEADSSGTDETEEDTKRREK